MRRWIVATAVAAVTAGAMTASAAGAADKDAHAWWWRAQPGLLGAAIPPPGVPEDGLAIEATPDGPNAVSALRYVLDDGETQPALVLTVADQQGAVEIQACAATQSWDAAHGGPWDERPTYNCGTAVDGEASEDGETWRWELDTLLRKRQLDVVLVPAPGVGRVTFAAPDDASLETQREEAGGQSFEAPPVSDFTDDAASSGAGSSGDSSSSDFAGAPSNAEEPVFPAGGSSGTTAQSPESAQLPAVAPPDTSDAQPPQAAGPPESPIAPVAAVPAGSDSSRTAGAIIAAMATVLALALWLQGRSAAHGAGSPGRVGSGAARQHVGGLGRFARPRTGAPRPLL